MTNKLLTAKELWAKIGRKPAGQPDAGPRLPPGQRETRDWPVLDLGITPRPAPQDWGLSVSGLVEQPLRWDWDGFHALPRADMTLDLHCVTGWSRFATRLGGVAMTTLLDLVKPTVTASHVMLHSYDGYSTNLPLSYLCDPDVLLCDQWNDQPLPPEHGGPLRLIVPKLYLWKSAKWLRHITFMAGDSPGYWEVRGYHMRGDPWTEERYG